MKKVELLNLKGEKVKDINLNEEIFGITPNKNVLTDAIVLSMASLRQGTHKTKNRSEVSGGGRKPWRQKGTGHARQGSIRAVQWVGGGNYGTPVPRDYSKKQNRKERQIAIKSALAEKVANNELLVLENLNIATPKTKDMINVLETLKMVGLFNDKDKKYANYSLGMRQKLSIAQALMENPKVIILDEPFNGIDRDSVKKIQEELLRRRKDGALIIITTHIHEDIDELCDKVLYLEDGKLNEK